jgi:hypothetical protein
MTPAPEIVAPLPIVMIGFTESVNAERTVAARLFPLTRRRAPSPLSEKVSGA